MIAVDEDRATTRGFEKLSERVLTVAGIYGPNASGKSNVLNAIAWLSEAVSDSLAMWDKRIPREPFKFGQGPQSPTIYDVEMMVDGIRYAYHLEVTSPGFPTRPCTAIRSAAACALRARRPGNRLSPGTRRLGRHARVAYPYHPRAVGSDEVRR